MRKYTKLAAKISMHGVEPEICAIARAAVKAGLSDSQSVLLARIALIVSTGSDCLAVPSVAKSIERTARSEHAANHPNGKWAELAKRYPDRWMYMDADSSEARSWSTPMLDSSYNIREAI